jgi:integrase
MILLWAEKHKLIERAPYIERPPKPKPNEKHLTRGEVYGLRDCCDLPHMRLFVLLAYATAARSSALLGLRWERVDFDRGKIDLRDPGITTPHKGRAIVPINNTLRAALQEAQRGALTPFVIEWAGKPVRSVKKGLATAARKAGLGKVSPHQIRHSSAVHLAEAGVPFEEIAAFLGHSDVKVTRTIYARFSDDHLKAAASALELDEIGPVAKRRMG